MDIIYHGYVEMIKATYGSGVERIADIEKMVEDGWIVFREYLNDEGIVVVTYAREIEIESE
jgi:hypothetical protein